MAQDQLLYLSHDDVSAVDLPMTTVMGLVEKAFIEKGNARVEMPPKIGIHTMPDAFIHAMPAHIAALRSSGIKWVSGYPENQQKGLPYITGLLILNDVETGVPYAIMDGTWITAKRTGAASALSAKYLARPDSETLGILACGVQGRSHLEAFCGSFPIKRVYAYDLHAAAQEKFVSEMQAKFGIEIIGVQEPRQAVVDADLVVTSGPILKHPMPTIEKDWLRPGAFGSAVDFDSYWSGAAIAQMDLIATDDQAQFEYYRSIGYFQNTPTPAADLGEFALGSKRGRRTHDERTLAINLGLAIEDMAVAPEVYRLALAKGIGTWLSL